MRGRDTLGFNLDDIKDVGKNVFGGVHTAGKLILTAYGLRSAADSLESAEASAGLLPDWAGGAAAKRPAGISSAVVDRPDFVVLSRGGQQEAALAAPARVVVAGGRQFAGNGYVSGEGVGSRFSFGIDHPVSVDVLDASGAKRTFTDADMVLFLGGNVTTSVKGDIMGRDQIGYDEDNERTLQALAIDDIDLAEVNSVERAMRLNELDRFNADQNTIAELDAACVGSLDAFDALGSLTDFEANSTQLSDDALGFGVDPDTGEPNTEYVSDYVLGCDVICGVTDKKKKSTKDSKTNVATESGKQSPHKAAIANAAAAIKNAKDAGKKAADVAKSYKPKDHKTVVPLATVKVQGQCVLGTDKNYKPKTVAAIQKHVDAMKRTADAAKKTKLLADKAIKRANSADQVLKAVVKPPVVKMLNAKSPPTRIHGIGSLDDFEALGSLLDFEALGSLEEFDALLQGDDIVARGLADIGQDEYQQLLDGFTPPVRWNGTLPGPLSQADAAKVWLKAPSDGVVYDGGMVGFPDGSIGSYNWFYGSGQKVEDGILKSAGNASGYIYTRRGTQHHWGDEDQPRWMGQNNDDQVHDVNDDGSIKDFSLVSRFLLPWKTISSLTGGGDPSASKVNAASVGAGWGPLIGNPNNPNTAGLQFAGETGQWFWQAQNAPKEYTAAADKALADAYVLKAALDKDAKAAADAVAEQKKAEKDEKDAQYAAEQQVKADAAAEKQAGLDAERAERQALLDEKNAERQAEIDAKQAERDADLAAKQAERDADLAAKQAEYDLRQQQVQDASDQKVYDAQNAYYAQHPELLVDQGGGSPDDGGVEGPAGSPGGDPTYDALVDLPYPQY